MHNHDSPFMRSQDPGGSQYLPRGFFKYEELGDLGDLGDRKITIVTCLGNKGERTLGFDYSHKRTLNKDVDGARTTTTTTTTATDWCKFPNGHPKTLLPT